MATTRNWPRHAATATLLGIAGYGAIGTIAHLIRAGDVTFYGAVFGVAFCGLLAGVFGWAAYCCHRRRYADLFMVGATVASLCLFAIASSAPRDFGWDAAIREWSGRHDLTGVPLFASLGFLLLPFCATAYFIKFAARFAARRIPNGSMDAAITTRLRRSRASV